MKEQYDKTLDYFAWNSKQPFKANGVNKVFLGKDFHRNCPVIVKALPINQFTDEYILNDLIPEWQTTKTLKNPFLCEVFQILLTKNCLYIFEEYCFQGSLRTFIQDGKKDCEKIRKFLNDILKGLEYLSSKGVFHGNLKPENFLIASGSIKINDYSFKKKIYRKNPNHNYQSPAQLSKENKNFKIDDDLWGLACVYYELLVGEPIFFSLKEPDLMEKFLKLQSNDVNFPKEMDKLDQEIINGVLFKGWGMKEILNSTIIKDFRIAESKMLKSKAQLNELDYSSKLIIMGIEQTIKRNNIDLEGLFNRLDSSGDQTIDLEEFQSLLRLIDPKLLLDQIEHVFKLIDNDGSGSINLEEFKILMGMNSEEQDSVFEEIPEMEEKLEKTIYVLREMIHRNGLNINAIFAKYDNSGDDGLDQKEFARLLKDISPSMEESVALYLFRKLDYDGSGDINLSEFKSYVLEDKELEKKLKELEEKSHEAINLVKKILYGQKLDMKKLFLKADKKNRGKINEEEFKELLLLIDSSIKPEIVKHIFKKIDTDGSGIIDYEEFSNYFK